MDSAVDLNESLNSQLRRMGLEPPPPSPPAGEMAKLQLTSPQQKPATKRRNRRLSGILPCASHRMTLRSRRSAALSNISQQNTPQEELTSPEPLTPFDQLLSPSLSSASSISSSVNLISSDTDVSRSVSDCALADSANTADNQQADVSTTAVREQANSDVKTNWESKEHHSKNTNRRKSFRFDRRPLVEMNTTSTVLNTDYSFSVTAISNEDLHQESSKRISASTQNCTIRKSRRKSTIFKAPIDSLPGVLASCPTTEHLVTSDVTAKDITVDAEPDVTVPLASKNNCYMEASQRSEMADKVEMAPVITGASDAALEIPQPPSTIAPVCTPIRQMPPKNTALSSVRRSRRKSVGAVLSDMTDACGGYQASCTVVSGEAATLPSDAGNTAQSRRTRRRSAIYIPSTINDCTGRHGSHVIEDKVASYPQLTTASLEDNATFEAPAVRRSRRKSSQFFPSDFSDLQHSSLESATFNDSWVAPKARKTRRSSDIYIPSASHTSSFLHDIGSPNRTSAASAAPSEDVPKASLVLETHAQEASARKSRRRSFLLFSPFSRPNMSETVSCAANARTNASECPNVNAPEQKQLGISGKATAEKPPVRRSSRRRSGRFTAPTPLDQMASMNTMDNGSAGDIHIDNTFLSETTSQSEVSLVSTSSASAAELLTEKEGNLSGDAALSSDMINYYLNKPYEAPKETLLETISEDPTEIPSRTNRQRRCAPKGSVRRCDFDLSDAKTRLRTLKAKRVRTLNKVLHRKGKTKYADKLLQKRLRELDAFHKQCDKREAEEATEKVLAQIKSHKGRSMDIKPEETSMDQTKIKEAQSVSIEMEEVDISKPAEIILSGQDQKELLTQPTSLTTTSCSISLLSQSNSFMQQVRQLEKLSAEQPNIVTSDISSPEEAYSTPVPGQPEPESVFSSGSTKPEVATSLSNVNKRKSFTEERVLYNPSVCSIQAMPSTPPTTTWEDAAFVFATPQPLTICPEQLHFPTPRLQREHCAEPMTATPNYAPNLVLPVSGTPGSTSTEGAAIHRRLSKMSPSQGYASPNCSKGAILTAPSNLSLSLTSQETPDGDGISESFSLLGDWSTSSPLCLEMTDSSIDSIGNNQVRDSL